jgi:hypothetical protein
MIVRAVEFGVTITDAAIDGETTVVWCKLRATGPDRCPGCGTVGMAGLPADHRRLPPPDPRGGKTLLAQVIDSLRTAVRAGLDELATVGRTLHGRRDDVLAYFTHPASNGPTETINGRLEALRRKCPRVPQPDQLPHPIPTALRSPRTVNPEEPVIGRAVRSAAAAHRWRPWPGAGSGRTLSKSVGLLLRWR